MEEGYDLPTPIWEANCSNAPDFLETIFPLDEAILEEMMGLQEALGGLTTLTLFPDRDGLY